MNAEGAAPRAETVLPNRVQELPTAPAGTTKALVLSSGGVDSTTCLALAIAQLGAAHVTTVSVFYGQKHKRELESANAVAAHYGVAHRTLDLSAILADSNNALMANSTQEIAHGTYATQIERDEHGIVSTYVPFRNGLILSAAAALAMSLYPDDSVALYLGAHADDAAGNAYPDCSSAFTDAMGSAISIGTYERVRLVTPFVNHTKADVVACGLALGVPYELTWSCYEGGERACGTCATCLDRKAAFHMNGVEDPIEYA